MSPGQTIEVARLAIDAGEKIDLDRVLLLADTDVTVGNPTINGVKVTATVAGDGRAKKIIVYKYKPKVRYRRKKGHRQSFTRLVIDSIVKAGEGEESTGEEGLKKDGA